MGYEVKIPLKVGTLEVEFDGVPELERKLRALDVRRIEAAVLEALRGPKPARRKPRARKKA